MSPQECGVGTKITDHVFLLEQLKNYQVNKGHAKTVSWSHDGRTCVERFYELANKKVEQLYTISSLCLDDHPFKQEELESVGEVSQVCSQSLNASTWHESEDQTFYALSTIFARAVTAWTRTSDERSALLHLSHE